MTDFHGVGLSEDSSPEARKLAEAAGPAFVRQGLITAREKTWKVLHEIRKEIREGLSEREGFQLALKVFHGFGVDKHWHKPYLRFGPGTTLTFRDPLQPDYRLTDGDAYYIDLGPVWKDDKTGIEYEGDVGDTYVLGDNLPAEKCADTARELFGVATDYWREKNSSGVELYAFLDTEARKRGYVLKDQVDGHRVSDYPHNKYSKERLAGLEFCPTPLIWVLEVQIVDQQSEVGAFFEDLLLPR